MDKQMQFASAIVSEVEDVQQICQNLIAQIRLQLEDVDPHLLLIFLSPHFAKTTKEIIDTLQLAFEPKVLMGCTGESIIGSKVEVEQKPAVSVLAAYMPRVRLEPFSLQRANWRMTLQLMHVFRRRVPLPADTRLVIMLADPFSTPMERVLHAFNKNYPKLPISGGLVSGSYKPRGNTLILNGHILNEGLVGVGLAGPLEADVVVSQGCRPIGRPLRVTASHKNTILKLEEQLAFSQLQKLLDEISPADQELLQNGLFVGRAIKNRQENLGRGDFLIRGVLNIDQEEGSLSVGDYFRRGEMMQFHVRDAATAQEDLEMMLAPQLFYEPPAGGLLFSCNSRGTRLYNYPNGDVSTLQKLLHNLNLAGFFCAGEIGQIGNRNFLHGHTASLALLRPTE